MEEENNTLATMQAEVDSNEESADLLHSSGDGSEEQGEDEPQTAEHIQTTRAASVYGEGMITELTTIREESEARSRPATMQEIISETDGDSGPRPDTRPKLPSQQGRALLARTASGGPRRKNIENNDVTQNNDLIREADITSVASSILITELNEEGEQVDTEHYDTQILEQKLGDEVINNVEKAQHLDEDYSDEDFDDDTTTIIAQTSQRPVEEEDDWDTDLEDEDADKTPNHDPTGRTQYLQLCEKLGVVPVSYFLRNITKKSIRMRNHGLGPKGSRAIARILRNNLTLEKLDLEGNWMQGEGGRAMAKMLEENEYLTEISLANNKLGSYGAYYISKTLQNNNVLRKVNLSGNEFTDKDAEDFADVIEKNIILRDLNLSHNQFSDDAALLFGPAIGANDVLDVLNLSWNHIRQRGAVALAKGIAENVILKTCDLSWNGLGVKGGLAIADTIASNSSLLELDISGNRLTIEVALRIARALGKNETLRVLKMGNNAISTAGCIEIAKEINKSDTSVLVFLDLSDIPVEYEFLRIIEEVQQKRDLRVIHGPVLCSGNTSDDVGKPSVNPKKKKDPLLVLKEHMVINDPRVVGLLQRYDKDKSLSVSAEDFIAVLQELKVPFNKEQLKVMVNNLDKNEKGKINYGHFLNGPQEAMVA